MVCGKNKEVSDALLERKFGNFLELGSKVPGISGISTFFEWGRIWRLPEVNAQLPAFMSLGVSKE